MNVRVLGLKFDIILLLVSFIMICNVEVFQGSGVRLLDLVGFVGFAVFFVRLFLERYRTEMVFVLFVLCFFLIQALRGLVMEDTSMVIAAARIMLSITTAVVVGSMIQRSSSAALSFCLGGAIGGAAVAFIAYGQATWQTPFFMGFAPPEANNWWYEGGIRAVGIAEHPNGLAQHQAVAVALALNLFFISRNNLVRLAGLLLYMVILYLTYTSTQTRAFLAVSLFVFILAFNMNTSSALNYYRIFFVFLVLSAPFLIQPILGDRWFGTTAVGASALDNVAERIWTSLQSVGLILVNPLGYGFAGRLEAQFAATGVLTASHNAYLSIALTFGLIAGAIVLVPIVLCLADLIRRERWVHISFLPLIAMSVMFFFEDSLFGMTIQMSLCVLIFSVMKPLFSGEINTGLKTQGYV